MNEKHSLFYLALLFLFAFFLSKEGFRGKFIDVVSPAHDKLKVTKEKNDNSKVLDISKVGISFKNDLVDENCQLPGYSELAAGMIETQIKALGKASTITSNSPRTIDGVTLLKFPYPYRAMLSISSDADSTRMGDFEDVFTFLRTSNSSPFGEGLNLDITHSLWTYSLAADKSKNDVFSPLKLFNSAEAPPEYLAPYKNYVSEGVYIDSNTEEKTLTYAKNDWLDTLHGYGSIKASGPLRFNKTKAQAALEYLKSKNVNFRVWTNHGSISRNKEFLALTDFCEKENKQAICSELKNELYNHLDMIKDYGVEYIRAPGLSTHYAFDSMVKKQSLQNGYEIQSFYGLSHGVSFNEGKKKVTPIWHPMFLAVQLHPELLDNIVSNNQYGVLKQHFIMSKNGKGALKFSQNCTEGQKKLPRHAIDALRRLKNRNDKGEILVAGTYRGLRYNAVNEGLEYNVIHQDKDIQIDFVGVSNGINNNNSINLEDLEGISLEIPFETKSVSLSVNRKGIDQTHYNLIRTKNESTIVKFKWRVPNNETGSLRGFEDLEKLLRNRDEKSFIVQ